MCTDVDRNDKSRICVPGQRAGDRPPPDRDVLAADPHRRPRRGHGCGPGFDALDAFLAHTWAVTVTGAPKAWAMQFIEDHERSPRAWYGGAVGLLGFDGNLNTGLTLRTIRVKDGVAEVRVGRHAALRLRSRRRGGGDAAQGLGLPRRHPAPPAASTRRRGRGAAARRRGPARPAGRPPGLVRAHAGELSPPDRRRGRRRCGPASRASVLDELRPDLVVLSPGPGTPSDFDVSGTLDGAARARRSRSSASASGCRAWSSTSAASSACSTTRCTARPRASSVRGGRLFDGPARRVHRGPLPLALRAPREAARRAAR